MNQNNVSLQVSLDADISPLINDVYIIGNLEVINGDIEISEGAKLMLLDPFPGEKPALEHPEIVVGDMFYELTVKNIFIPENEVVKEKYGGYIWFSDEGGYPILKIK